MNILVKKMHLHLSSDTYYDMERHLLSTSLSLASTQTIFFDIRQLDVASSERVHLPGGIL